MTYIRIYFISVTLLFFLFQANGQDHPEHQLRRNYNLKPAVGIILIDGNLNEETWNNTEPSTDFKMSFPVDNQLADPASQTQVKLTFDDQNLYIGAVCFGENNYIIQTLKRDNTLQTGDAFGVVIDPVNERTNGFVFGVNPMGVQTEMLVSGKTGRREILEPGRTPKGVNVAWDNKWYSEVKRYDDRWEIEIAIPFKTLRFDAGKTIWGINFFRIDAQSNSIHTWEPIPIEFPEIDLGYTGQLIWENPPKKIKSNISLIPYVLSGVSRDFENNSPNKTEFQTGIDGKIAITSGLNFDLTVNPNFSQVEIDEQVTNLTLFNVRLPEKRLFFLENSDVFEDFGIPPMKPFFSRRIGLDENGNPIPILFGARLSGNINKDLRIGAMNMQTQETVDFFAQNYTALAFHQKLFSRSVIKGYFHNRQATKIEEADYNRNAGLEFLYRSTDGRFQSLAGYSKSFNPGENDKNYFYSNYIGYDSRNFSIYSNLAGVGENYIADMGYFRGQEYYDAERDTVIRIGMHHWYTRASYTFYATNSEKIISHEIGGRNIYDAKSDFTSLLEEFEVNYNLRFSNTSLVVAAFSTINVNLLYPFSFTGATPLPAGYYKYGTGEIGFESDQRKLFGFGTRALYGGFYNGTRSQLQLNLKYRVQPWGNFAVMFEYNNLQFPEPHGSRILFNITPRIDFNFSRNLFWTTFMQYETQGDNFNINSRIQWRFQPMSDIYLVYTDNYSIEHRIPKYRALMLKINYWLNL
jgi:hypothetical protein